MASRINHALFREVARRHAASRSEIYSAALTRRKTIPRCATRYMVSHWCVFSPVERDDCAWATSIRYEARMRERFTMSVGESAVRGGLHDEPFCGLPRLLYAGKSGCARREKLFSCRIATRYEFASRSQHDAMRRAARRRPDFELLNGLGTLTTLHSCRTGWSIGASTLFLW